MQRLDRPAVLDEPGGQVIEELGVGRRLAPHAEIARCRDQGRAEVVHPDPVDQGAGRQRVVGAGDGPRQLEPAAAVDERFPLGTGQRGEEPARHRFAQVVGIAAHKDTRLDRRGCVFQAHDSRRRAGATGQPLLHGVTQLLELGLRGTVG